jgi:enoyl-CoA hydratase
LSDYENVKFQLARRTAIITMDRPPVNALSIGLYRDIEGAFKEVNARTDEIHAVILTGAGRCFCAGRDLKVAETEPPELRSAHVKAAMGALYHCSVPVIGAINGPAMGAGFALTALCDFVIASERAVFAMPEIDANVNPSVAMLLRGFGQYMARAMAFTGERYSGEDMQRMGLVRRVVTHDELLTTATELADVLAAKSPVALRAAKWSATEVELLFSDFELAYGSIESRVSISLLETSDHKEAARAFAEKRTPGFTGR